MSHNNPPVRNAVIAVLKARGPMTVREIAEELEWPVSRVHAVVANGRRLHAENTTLQHGYDAARMEIDGLRDCVQELGAMLRENRSKRIVELEAQLEAIGAGGVEPMRPRKCLHGISEPSGWMPIETAPKNGRTLLLGRFNSHGKWRTMRGQWMSESYIAEYWEDPDDVEPGWFETAVEPDDPPNCWPIKPTHWMPLPPSPSSADEGGSR